MKPCPRTKPTGWKEHLLVFFWPYSLLGNRKDVGWLTLSGSPLRWLSTPVFLIRLAVMKEFGSNYLSLGSQFYSNGPFLYKRIKQKKNYDPFLTLQDGAFFVFCYRLNKF